MSDTIRSVMVRKYSLAIVCGTGALCCAANANADSDVKVDWTRAVVEVDQFVRNAGGLAAERRPLTGLRSEKPNEDPFVLNGGNAWAGVTPRVALVARDWATHYRLAGDRLSLADSMRLSQSTRMVISRVRFGDGRVRPFLQVGLGQWRTDTNLLPFTPRQEELACQGGGGIELLLSRKWQLALESSTTALASSVRETEQVPVMRMWSATIASRIEF